MRDGGGGYQEIVSLSSIPFFLFLTSFPVVLSPYPALARGYPAKKLQGKLNSWTEFMFQIWVQQSFFTIRKIPICQWVPGKAELTFPFPLMQTPSPEQFHDSGYHEWFNAGHHGACWQWHHRQGETLFVPEANDACARLWLFTFTLVGCSIL